MATKIITAAMLIVAGAHAASAQYYVQPIPPPPVYGGVQPMPQYQATPPAYTVSPFNPIFRPSPPPPPPMTVVPFNAYGSTIR